jgi:transcriptional regulator with XRE-family HTH domain
MSYFGKNLKKIRSIHQLSQQDFGSLFELSRASIGSYEEGRADPKIESLIKIARYFKLNIHDLLTSELHSLEKGASEAVKKEEPTVPLNSKVFIEERIDLLEERLQKLENILNSSK